jgi:hypothetical protein
MPLRVWRPGAGTSSRVMNLPRGVNGLLSGVVGASSGGSVLLDEYGNNRWVVDVDRPGAAEPLRLQTSTADELVLDPTGTRLAGLYNGPNGASPSRVVAGPLPVAAGEAPDVTLRFVPKSGRTVRVLAWTDSTHPAVVRLVGERFSRDSALLEVDVRTGAATQRVRLPDEASGSNLQFATDLPRARTTEATERATARPPIRRRVGRRHGADGASPGRRMGPPCQTVTRAGASTTPWPPGCRRCCAPRTC